MQISESDALLEAALHAFITARCQRAYLHDLRNGLQGIYGGFDALTRSLKGEGSTKIPVERAIEFTRQAIKNHEQSLQSILESLTLQSAEPIVTDIGATVREVARFLNNDASARDITLQIAAGDAVNAAVRPPRLRLLLMSLLVNAIDTLDAGSELKVQVAKREQHAGIDIEEVSARGVALNCERMWELDLATPLPRSGMLLPTVRRLAIAEGGTIECCAENNQRRFSIRLPLRTL